MNRTDFIHSGHRGHCRRELTQNLCSVIQQRCGLLHSVSVWWTHHRLSTVYYTLLALELNDAIVNEQVSKSIEVSTYVSMPITFFMPLEFGEAPSLLLRYYYMTM